MADSSVQDLNKMKVADLKKELKLRGLNTVGNKNELVDRLNAALENDAGKIDNLSTETEELMDDVLNDDEDLDDEIEDADVEEAEKVLENEGDTSIVSTDDPKSPRANKRKLSELSDDSSVTKAAPRKIVLNRVLSVNNSQNKPESTTEKTSTEQEKEVPKEKEAITAVGTTEGKRVIKLSNLSVKERLEMRAKKFGTALTTDQKKEARSARFGGQVPITNVTSATSKISITNPDTKIEALKKRAERFGTSVSPIMSKLDTIDRLERRKARFGVVNAPAKKEAIVK
ncbi:SAP domain-containing ribonucleoprotein [Chrysoperla carnea]|uniref:SAP domain-containing ribonucleoprotein n=1 Tax=Chrysoperla carnea TaxID=189513 RepID=UPI001D068373|nr:SAP domain-containing ribonucleoprotein [Chrysoperla carnea]